MRKKVLLYGAVGFDWWSDANNTAERIMADIASAEADASVTEIAIHINSSGGDVHEGLGIYNAIKAATKPTVAVIDGVAYSMAAIIALAANKTQIANNGMFMLHNASGMDWGNAKQFRTTADLLDKYDNQLAVGVAAKTGLSLEEVKNLWFNYEDNFFTAQEAFGAQLVDEVLNMDADLPEGFEAQGPLLKVAAQLGKHFMPKQQSWFNKLVTRVADALPKAEPAAPPTPENLEKPMIIKNNHTALAAFFGAEAVEGDAVLNVQPTEAQIEALNARLEAAAAAEANATALRNQLDAANLERQQLQAEVDRLGLLAGQAPTPAGGGDDPEPTPAPAGEVPSWIKAAEKAGYTKK